MSDSVLLSSLMPQAEATRLAVTFLRRPNLDGVGTETVDLARRCSSLLSEVAALKEETNTLRRENAVLTSKVTTLSARSSAKGNSYIGLAAAGRVPDVFIAESLLDQIP